MRVQEKTPRVGVRWTIGDVSDAGFEALRVSIFSAFKLFGKRAQYAVCVNTVSSLAAKKRTGELPFHVSWLDANDLIPQWLHSAVSREMAEGVAWKLAPVRLFPSLHEVSLDNDVILWALPEAMQHWLRSDDSTACLMAADVQPAFGQFAPLCRNRALNSGIRGLPPGFDMEGHLRTILLTSGRTLQSELDEQGLQAAVLVRNKLFVVSTEDVSICSPFEHHQKHLGKCGVHFVGLNPKQMPWTIDGRRGHEVMREHWESYAEELTRFIGHDGSPPAGSTDSRFVLEF